ncbi:MAG: NUDIX domain-containing protein, partial [Thermoplasmata archaeon]
MRRFDPFREGAPIVPELSSGAVIATEDGKKVLLLHEIAEDRWLFPKGHVDPGESLETAALR